MNFRYIIFSCLVCIILCKPNANYYKAAVVEFMPIEAKTVNVTQDQASSVMNRNIDRIIPFLKEAQENAVEIIVFPEYGLSGINPWDFDTIFPYLERIPNVGTNPCEKKNPKTPIINRLSCLAKKYRLLIVIAVGDVQPCSKEDTHCPPSGRFQYNTQIAFELDGRILAKYAKTNLYFENHFNAPISQKPVTFVSSFGVKFGLFICFDILFEKPQIGLLKDLNVKDIIFPTWWWNTGPRLTGTQMQQGWARSNNVTLLASSAGNGYYSSGSGIYYGSKVLATYFNPNRTRNNHMLISVVPKRDYITQERDMTQEKDVKYYHEKNFPNNTADYDSESEVLKKADSEDFKAPEYHDSKIPQPQDVKIPKSRNTKAQGPLSIKLKQLKTWEYNKLISENISVDGIYCSLEYSVHSMREGTNDTLLFYAINGHITPLFPSVSCGVSHCPSYMSNPSECIDLIPRETQVIDANTFFGIFSLHAQYDPKIASEIAIFPVSATQNGQLFENSQILYQKVSRELHSLSLTSDSSLPVLNIGFFGKNLTLPNVSLS